MSCILEEIYQQKRLKIYTVRISLNFHCRKPGVLPGFSGFAGLLRQSSFQHVFLKLPRKEMRQSQEHLPVFPPEGVGTVPVAAFPVHIAQICHGTGLAGFVVDVCPERRGGSQGLKKEFVGADGMAEMLLDPGFLLQRVADQAVGDAEPVGAFPDLDAAFFQAIDAKQSLEQRQDVVSRLRQRGTAFPEKVPGRYPLPRLGRYFSVEGQKFFSGVGFKEGVNLILGF